MRPFDEMDAEGLEVVRGDHAETRQSGAAKDRQNRRWPAIVKGMPKTAPWSGMPVDASALCDAGRGLDAAQDLLVVADDLLWLCESLPLFMGRLKVRTWSVCTPRSTWARFQKLCMARPAAGEQTQGPV